MPVQWGLAIHPMLAQKATEPFDDPDWIFELKWDGTRALCHYDKGSLRFQNRRLYDITTRYPELRVSLNAERAIVDGEVVVMDDGKPSFQALQRREHLVDDVRIARLAKEIPATYVVFDLLWVDGEDLTGLPLMDRKKRLAEVFEPSPAAVLSEFFEGEGKAFYRICMERGLEGIMAKAKSSKYVLGKRSKFWKKIKAVKMIECVVAGVTMGEGNREDTFGALVLALYDGDDLVCIGRVGTGFDTNMRELLLRRLRTLETDMPFKEHPDLAGDQVLFWTRPELAVEVEYLMLTPDRALRAPSFQRPREDVDPRECHFPGAASNEERS
jgi:DNA ligase D-like protein (predicted ligase)